MTNNDRDMDLESLKKSYELLKERERKYREIIDTLPETVFEADLEGRGTFVNDAGLALFGYSREDFGKGVEITNLFCDYEKERIKANYEKVLKGERNQSTEYMALKKDGTVFPVLVHSCPIISENRPVGIRGVTIDITENYKIRKQLEREKDFVNSLLDTANSMVICLDTDENIIMFNKECEKLTGYKLEEVRGKNWPETFIPEESRRKSDLPFSEWIKIHPEDRYDAPLMTKSGEIKTILWSNTVFSPKGSDEVIALAIGHDVTEQMKAVKALQESEKHYRAVWDNLPVGICLTDRDGVYRYVNPAYCKIYGYEKEDLIGRTPDSLIFPSSDPEKRKKYHNKRFDGQITTSLTEYQFYKSDGMPVWIEVASDYIRENGSPKFLISINIDVTMKKLAESALKETEQRYSILFEYVDVPIFTVDKDGVFRMMNKAAAGYLGGIPDDFIGKTMWDLFPRKVALRQMDNIIKTLEKSKPMTEENYTYVNNEKKWFKTGIYPITGAKTNASMALLIARDITSEVIRKIRMNARFQLLDNLRHAESVDDCLESGCLAIRDAQLFKRAVLTLHNEKREIIHLGQVGLDQETVNMARTARAPDKQLARQITQRKFKISNSYFVPTEAGFDFKTTERYIAGKSKPGKTKDSWKKNDEFFVPVFGHKKKIEGWLSVDTPLDGKRPDLETARFLEEICDMAMQRSRQIIDRDKLASERKALEEKNIALKEIMSLIEEEKAEIRQRIWESVERSLLPVLNRMIEEPENTNKSNLIVIKNSLKDLGTLSGGSAQLYSRLSTREIEICNLIKADWTSKEIAKSLNISITTVHKHRETIRRKLGLTNKEVNLKSYIKSL
ncbi:MAG: PAS domain S-box protein [Candidatus Zixiibacteriota bacterium]|nr:MAG: PAS domain S-box protein [candidate division Zixibacteria bacterium]